MPICDSSLSLRSESTDSRTGIYLFFLSLTILNIIEATTATRIKTTIIVPIFPESHESILKTLLSFSYFTLTVFVSLSASLYGRTSIYIIKPRTIIAKIRPKMLRLPVKAFPNWFIISEIAYANVH